MSWPKCTLICSVALIIAASPALGEGRWVGADRLTGLEIRLALGGKRVSYGAEGIAHTGVAEEFREDGSWDGQTFSRAPIPFSGRWSVADHQLCVTAETGRYAELWRGERRCREVWQDRGSSQLRMNHFASEPGSSYDGSMALEVHPLDDPAG